MKKIFIIAGLLIFYSLICYKIYIDNKPMEKYKTPRDNKAETETIGYLKIEKINLSQPLYKKESIHNNVEENITILEESIMPTESESIVFLAAHSGTGPIAYFERLDDLTLGDKIKLKYQNNVYTYKIINIWEEPKTGYIHVNKNKTNQLILTTCSPENDTTQLVINSIEEKNTSQN